jgi:hypothetical protein
MPWNMVMDKYKQGSLRSGNKDTGPRVTSQPQAIAIMMSERQKADNGDDEYKMKKPGSLKGFGKPKSYHPMKDAKTANY